MHRGLDVYKRQTYEIPSCILEPTAVTKENIDKVIIEGGFHRRDEVYLNADYS